MDDLLPEGTIIVLTDKKWILRKNTATGSEVISVKSDKQKKIINEDVMLPPLTEKFVRELKKVINTKHSKLVELLWTG